MPGAAIKTTQLALTLTFALCGGVAWAEGVTHTVAPGESLGGIAAAHGCSVAEVMRANRGRVTDPDRVRSGMKLTIPACTGTRRRGVPTQCRWTGADIQSKALRAPMRARGFSPPSKFRALVVKTTLSKDRKRIVKHELFDYAGDGNNPKGWNPASTIKIFSGIAALERVRQLGFSPEAKVTYHYDGGDKTFGLSDLYEDAVHWSKNVPHNRLTQLAGFDNINGPKGSLQGAGLEHSYIIRAYAKGKWLAEGQTSSLRSSPAITLREGRRVKRLAATSGTTKPPCWGAACTSLSDLARMMCALILHEQLPPNKSLKFARNRQDEHLAFIRREMHAKRAGRKDPIWDIFEKAFIPRGERGTKRGEAKPGRPQLFRKNGFARKWASENIFVLSPNSRVQWSVTMAGYPGRYSLTTAADIIASIIADGEL